MLPMLLTGLYVLLCCREPDAVPDDFPESDDDDSSDPDPLGLLTWPLENKPRNLTGSAAALVGLGSSAASAAGKDRQQSSAAGFDCADLLVERYGSHTRSFSSEKIFQDFRELHRAGAGPQLSAAAAAGSLAAVNKGDVSPSTVRWGVQCLYHSNCALEMYLRTQDGLCMCSIAASFRNKSAVSAAC